MTREQRKLRKRIEIIWQLTFGTNASLAISEKEWQFLETLLKADHP